jgi:2-phosphoglycerate kinase
MCSIISSIIILWFIIMSKYRDVQQEIIDLKKQISKIINSYESFIESIYLQGSIVEKGVKLASDIDLVFILKEYSDDAINAMFNICDIISQNYGKKVGFSTLSSSELNEAFSYNYLQFDCFCASYSNSFPTFINLYGKSYNFPNFRSDYYTSIMNITRIIHDLIKSKYTNEITPHKVEKAITACNKILEQSKFEKSIDRSVTDENYINVIQYLLAAKKKFLEIQFPNSRKSRKVNLILITGISKSGKSTISKEIIKSKEYSLLQTDSIKYLSKANGFEIANTAIAQSYLKLPYLNSLNIDNTIKVILGYEFSCEVLLTDTKKIIREYLNLSKDLVVEGISLNPNLLNSFIEELRNENINVIPVFLYINGENHKKNIANYSASIVDNSYHDLFNNDQKYSDYLTVQDYLKEISEINNWNVIEVKNGNINNAIRLILDKIDE